ncbi:hypothetical protein Tco_0273798 [Tanacetum coccineum]
MKTPMSSDTKLTKDKECESVDSTKYRGMIGTDILEKDKIEAKIDKTEHENGKSVKEKSRSTPKSQPKSQPQEVAWDRASKTEPENQK